MRREILIMFVAMSLIPLGDTGGKLLSNLYGVSPVLIAWARFVIGGICLLPLVMRDRAMLGLLTDYRILARGITVVLTITCILTAFRTVPITTGFSILFIAPLISYFLSVIFLKEVITLRRTLLVIGGFIGVLMVAQPSAHADPNLIFAVLAGLGYGLFLTMSRAFAHLASPVQMTSTQMLIGVIMLMPFALMHWPDGNIIQGHRDVMTISGLVLLSGIASLGGNVLLIVAYRMAPATKLAPFVYFQIVAATILGVLVFDHWPNILALMGMFVVITCGVLSARAANAA